MDGVLRSAVLQETLSEYQRDLVTRLVRSTLQEYRNLLPQASVAPSADELAVEVRSRILRDWSVGPHRVINATGVILHTNLARAPLSTAARRAIETASGYSDLEFDLGDGRRGDRQTPVGRQLEALTGAEASFVTVSASAAVLLVLSALAQRREVIVSRGQSVEIGGGFRVPVVLKQSGAKLVEVGTTNRTRLEDYAEAINGRTAAILNVHASNFRIIGFTESVALPELARLAHANGIPIVDDNGSGALLETDRFGLAHEPTVQEALGAGVDLVAFSGDKLVGGPQSGIILGSATLVDRLRMHPLARAIRPDKVTVAALSATIHSYLAGSAESTVPVWRMIAQSPDHIESRARGFQSLAASRGLRVELVSGESTVGGGSLPGETLPTTLMRLPSSMKADTMRGLEIPIIARTQAGRTVIDLRTVADEEESSLLAGLLAAAGVGSSAPD